MCNTCISTQPHGRAGLHDQIHRSPTNACFALVHPRQKTEETDSSSKLARMNTKWCDVRNVQPTSITREGRCQSARPGVGPSVANYNTLRYDDGGEKRLASDEHEGGHYHKKRSTAEKKYQMVGSGKGEGDKKSKRDGRIRGERLHESDLESARESVHGDREAREKARERCVCWCWCLYDVGVSE